MVEELLNEKRSSGGLMPEGLDIVVPGGPSPSLAVSQEQAGGTAGGIFTLLGLSPTSRLLMQDGRLPRALEQG